MIAVLAGGILGSIFMFAALGYFKPNPSETGANQGGSGSADSQSATSGPPSLPGDSKIVSDEISMSRRNAIVRAAEKIDPAVVSLSVIQLVESQDETPFGSYFWDLLNMPKPKVKVLSLGSGVIINPEGYVLTNHHVVEGAKKIRVTLMNGDEYPGGLVGSDPVTDLAVVKIFTDSSAQFPNAVLGDSDDLIIGEWAIAVGNPFGYLLEDSKPTVTVGVISATDRDIKSASGQQAIYRKMIQTDAAINPGNSGGPLVNALGEVIGINTFIFTLSRGSEGVGFAVPINRAKLIINDIMKYGEVVKAWIGLKVQAITPDVAGSLNLERTRGLVITSVRNNSPASKAGLRAGDVLLSIGNDKMKSEADWEEIESYARAGRPLGVEIMRGKERLSQVVIPAESPTREAANKVDRYGLKVAEITPEVANYAGVSDRSGVLVLGASDTTWASGWDFREGDIIKQIGKHKVQGLDDYIDTMKTIGRGYLIEFLVDRSGELVVVRGRT